MEIFSQMKHFKVSSIEWELRTSLHYTLNSIHIEIFDFLISNPCTEIFFSFLDLHHHDEDSSEVRAGDILPLSPLSWHNVDYN